MSSSGMTTVAPASTAFWNLASTSVTVRWMVTGEPPNASGVTALSSFISGKSSLSMTIAPLIRSAAWNSRPSGPGTRPSSSASNALT